MAKEAFDTILKLARLAQSPNEHEATASARKACALMLENEDAIGALGHSARRQSPSVHPLVAVLQRFNLTASPSARRGWCVSCAEPYLPMDEVIFHPSVGATHLGCRFWWADADLTGVEPLPPDEEIPF